MASTIPPPLREALKIRKLTQGGEVVYIVKEPDKGSYYKFDEAQYQLLSLFDGTRDIPQIIKSFDAINDEEEYDTEDVEDLIEAARECQLLQRSREEANAALLEKIKEERKGMRAQVKGSLLHMRYSLIDPNEIFDRIIDRIRFLWHPLTVKCFLGLILAAIIAVILNHERFVADLEQLAYQTQENPWNLLVIWMIALGAIALHECAHGLTCKYYGGDVHEIGVLLLCFQPCMYCNVNDAWMFDNTRHKIYVAAVGVWAELVLSAIAVFVWLLVDTAHPVGFVAFTLVLVSTASSLFMNVNPLMKFDGYYILSDVLEMPNLRENSIGWFSWNLKKHVFRLDVEPPSRPTRREKKVYFLYGMLVVTYLTVMLSGIAVLLHGAVADTLGTLGLIAYLWLVVKMARAITGSWTNTLKEWAMLRFWSTKPRKQVTAILSAAALAVFVFWQSPVTIETTGTVEAETLIAHAPESGFIEAVSYTPERTLAVTAGQPLFHIRAPQLQLEAAQLDAQRASSRIDAALAASRNDAVGRQHTAIQRKSLGQRNASLQQRLSRLAVTAPAGDWRVDGPPPQVLEGRYVEQGETVLTLIPAQARQMTVILEQSDLSFVEAGQKVLVRLTGSRIPVLQGKVTRIAPVTRVDGPNRLFQVRIALELPEDVPSPPPDMTGEVKILGQQRPLWEHALRAVRKTLRTDLWI